MLARVRSTSLVGIVLALVVVGPPPAPACSYRPPAIAVRVSGEHGAGHRPWLYVPAVPGLDSQLVAPATLRRRGPCGRGKPCVANVALERVGDFLRPAADLAPGPYRLSTAVEDGRSRSTLVLAELTVRRRGPRAVAAPGVVHLLSATRDQTRDTCADGTPDLFLSFDDWDARRGELEGRVVLVYDRQPDRAAPLAGVVKVRPVAGALVAIRTAGPGERWQVARAPDRLWVALSDDDGTIGAPVEVRAD